MTTKELMLGDYITLADCFNDGKEPLIFKVVGLGYDDENSALVLLNGEKACDIVEIDDEWCGIPITPEILEKSGWKHDPSVQRAMINTNYQRNNYLSMSWDSKSHILKISARRDCDIKIPCEYVHELQHALRICGIDKEIEL